MFHKFKKHSKIALVAVLTVIILSSFAVIITAYFSDNHTDSDSDAAVTSNVAPEVYKCLSVTHIYTCGHTEKVSLPVPDEYKGKTVEEIKSLTDEFDILTSNEALLEGTINENVKCDKHYRIQLSGNVLEIYCEKHPDTPERKLLINTKGYYEEDVDILKNGIEFNSKEAMLEFIEDLES